MNGKPFPSANQRWIFALKISALVAALIAVGIPAMFGWSYRAQLSWALPWLLGASLLYSFVCVWPSSQSRADLAMRWSLTTLGMFVPAVAIGVMINSRISGDLTRPERAVPNSYGNAKVESVEIVDATGPDGKPYQEVLTRWKSSGTAPVRYLVGTVSMIGDDNKPMINKSYRLYRCENEAPGIAPGQSYQTPRGEGSKFYDLPKRAVRAEVQITYAETKAPPPKPTKP